MSQPSFAKQRQNLKPYWPVLLAQPEPIEAPRLLALHGTQSMFPRRSKCRPKRITIKGQLVATPKNGKETSYRN